MPYTEEDMFENIGFNDFFNQNDRSEKFTGNEKEAYLEGWTVAKQLSEDM